MNFPVRMTHPEHGATYADDSEHLKRLETYGWKVEGESAPVFTNCTVLDAPKRGRPRKAA